jgi:flagellar protein FlaG
MEIRPLSNMPITTTISNQQIVEPVKELTIKDPVIPQRNIPADGQLPKEELSKLVDGANQFFNFTRTHLQFQLHESLNQYYVEVRNTETNEVIKEVPSKKFLDMVAKLQELAGLLVDEKI